MSINLEAIHPTVEIVVRSNGEVLVPAVHNRPAHWTFGCTKGNRYAVIRVNGKAYFVHRLVAETFIPNPNNLPQVDHINRNRYDNRIENLRWTTAKENMRNQQRHDDSIAKYGVAWCDDSKAYFKARRRDKNEPSICR